MENLTFTEQMEQRALKIAKIISEDRIQKLASIRKPAGPDPVYVACPEFDRVWSDIKARRFDQNSLDGVKPSSNEVKTLSAALTEKSKLVSATREKLTAGLQAANEKLQSLTAETPWVAGLFFIGEITQDAFKEHIAAIENLQAEISNLTDGLQGLAYLLARTDSALRAVNLKIRLY